MKKYKKSFLYRSAENSQFFLSKVLLWKMVVKIALLFARNREDVTGAEWMVGAAEKIG